MIWPVLLKNEEWQNKPNHSIHSTSAEREKNTSVCIKLRVCFFSKARQRKPFILTDWLDWSVKALMPAIIFSQGKRSTTAVAAELVFFIPLSHSVSFYRNQHNPADRIDGSLCLLFHCGSRAEMMSIMKTTPLKVYTWPIIVSFET